MQNAPAGALFPAFFSDGERETLLGTVLVHPSLRFHDLKLTVARRIGVPPNQLAVFLADRGGGGDPPRSWPARVPVTDKFDFAEAARLGAARCCFLVVLRRPRRERRKGGGGGGRDEPARSPPENAMLLRRDRPAESPDRGRIPDWPVGGFRPAAAEQYRELELQAERERYLAMSAALEELRRRRRRSAGHGRVCEECEEEKRSGSPSAFHCCPNDPVVEGGFRTRAGPIARPAKRPGEGPDELA